ncbi:MAG: DEAD/DEAH box helicase family protein [Myxococcota bacterium]
MNWSLRFEGGTLVLDGPGPDALPEGFAWDGRIGRARAPAHVYGALVDALRDGEVQLEDRAKAYRKLEGLKHLSSRTPRPYQAEAVRAWHDARWRGVIVLPTGAGKSFVAERAIAETRRSTLVVVPTLDLLSQWYGNLKAAFGEDVGVVGGGVHELRDLTVTTYDSACLHMERFGDRFGLVIWDEAHHLPAPAYARAAEACIAPLRLGLSATPERPDGMEARLFELVGPICYRREITELAGDWLAEYSTEVVTVRLTDEEKARYDALRGRYRAFVDMHRISMRGPDGWRQFLQVSSRSKEGRAAFKAWLESKRIMHGTDRKLETVRALVAQEWGRRTIVFTNDNDTAYRIAEMLLAPCITHHTDVKERRAWLDAFAAGEVTVLVTSRVLNEGVDLPAAEVAVVVSGTSTVRESVQRLGRILRPGANKQAVLYELVSEGTTEVHASERRREHDAYR